MARRTRLWQAAGSPLIQGHTRRRAPFWPDLVAAVAASGVIAAMYDWVAGAQESTSMVGVASAFGLGVAAAAVPAAVALWVARSAGAARPRMIAGVAGSIAGVLAVVFVPAIGG